VRTFSPTRRHLTWHSANLHGTALSRTFAGVVLAVDEDAAINRAAKGEITENLQTSSAFWPLSVSLSSGDDRSSIRVGNVMASSHALSVAAAIVPNYSADSTNSSAGRPSMFELFINAQTKTLDLIMPGSLLASGAERISAPFAAVAHSRFWHVASVRRVASAITCSSLHDWDAGQLTCCHGPALLASPSN
jgi:hypothetical protein